MAQNLKPLLNQLKEKWEARNEIRESLVKNLKEKTKEVESKALEFAKQNKDNKIVTQYVRPLVESEKTEEVINKIQAKIKTPIATTLNKARKQFLEATQTDGETTPKRKKSTKDS